MHATARSHIARPAPPAPARPHLRAVAPRPRRRRVPQAATVALYAAGLVLGFLLAALASAPGGAGMVAGELRLAGVAALVGAVALLRARAVARRRPRIRRNPV
ncbi:MAG TPA: hypothetical protein VFG74_15945 [Miltoncostaeaceae bacterium]|jgi:hypothetical protein|nr:hypothetical protein [Miltoncostaeaceae bacterium]